MVSNKISCSFKAAIVGCGSVGASAAYAYVLDGSVTQMALVDIDEGKAAGLRLDLEHASTFTPNMQIDSSDDLSICQGANIVVISAGARQKEGESRLDLCLKNKKIYANIIPQIAKAAPNAILIIVSNPVDVLTYEAIKLSGFPKERVFGTGTVLDSIRLQFHISEQLQIHPSSIYAHVLGEHGDTSFPMFSSANVLGKSLFDFDNFSSEVADKCYEDTKLAAYRVIHDQGYTCYSIATVIREITNSIFEDKKQVFTLSVPLDNYYGNSDVCLSVPCVLGRGGVEQVLKVPLSKQEQDQLKTSCDSLKPFLN